MDSSSAEGPGSAAGTTGSAEGPGSGERSGSCSFSICCADLFTPLPLFLTEVTAGPSEHTIGLSAGSESLDSGSTDSPGSDICPCADIGLELFPLSLCCTDFLTPLPLFLGVLDLLGSVVINCKKEQDISHKSKG